MIKTRFIFNPRSGRNARNPHLLGLTRAFIKERGLDADIALTERPHHARELARRAVDEGCGLVVAIGGDGTLNEVASGVVHSPAAFGLIPCGSGNGLGRHLGIHGSFERAFDILVNGRIHLMDTGEVNGLPFFNAMGFGFDAEIADRFNRLPNRGFKSYVRTTLGTFTQRRPQPCTVQTDGVDLTTEAFILTVANSDQYGNNCFIAPGAQVDDGLLDLTVIKRVSLLGAVPLAARLFLGKLDGPGSVARLRSGHFKITRVAPGLIHTDGEVHPADAVLQVSVRPASLKIMVPASRP